MKIVKHGNVSTVSKLKLQKRKNDPALRISYSCECGCSFVCDWLETIVMPRRDPKRGYVVFGHNHYVRCPDCGAQLKAQSLLKI